MKNSIKLTVLLGLLLGLLLSSCGSNLAYIDFNRDITLDNDVKNQTQFNQDNCGGEPFKFTYTVKGGEKFAILEVKNNKSCDVEVEAEQELKKGTVTRFQGELGKFVIKKDDPAKVFAFDISKVAKGQKLHFSFNCKEATGEKGCGFYYRLTTANNNAKKPEENKKSVSLINLGTTSIPTTNDNKCETAKVETVLKTLKNTSKKSLIIQYNVVNECKCTDFIVVAELKNLKTNRIKRYNTKATRTVSTSGPITSEQYRISIKNGVELILYGMCDNGSDTECKGSIKDISITTKKNLKK
ncbi:hypothetical protein [Ascidiimonas sp. W6]|uniref:hypothetical protein n=1 Tax=Ascidiimonas meishanensis TaxID=3128903 RepID=UPI0030EB5F2E